MSEPTFHSRIMNIQISDNLNPAIKTGHKQARHAAAEIAAEADIRIKELEERLATSETEKFRLLGVAADYTEQVEELEKQLAAEKQEQKETYAAYEEEYISREMLEKKLAEVTEWESIAMKLYGYLDDIDTYEDVYKPHDLESFQDYASAVNKKHKLRHDLLKTDGYKVYRLPLPASDEVKS